MRAIPAGRKAKETDTRGIWIEATDAGLAARGLEDQEVVIPAGEIAAVTVTAATGDDRDRGGDFLAVLDKERRVLLWARGTWDDRGQAREQERESALLAVCRELDIAFPRYVPRTLAWQEAARWRRAPGYRLLRTRPGALTGTLTWCLPALALGGLGVALSILVAIRLPGSVGAVRIPVDVMLVIAALVAMFVLIALAEQTRQWLEDSLDWRAIAPLRPFFTVPADLREALRELMAVMLWPALAFCLVYGPFIGLKSLVHGLDDQSIVSALRQHGVSTQGWIYTQTTDDGDDGRTTTTWLEFYTARGTDIQTPDPSIGGRPWPADHYHVTVVYLPSHPATAAVAGQLASSPWRGAPTANLITGAILTVALFPLTWAAVRRSRSADRQTLDPAGVTDAG
jgi:hypothetical protein